jgi:DNA polymerase-3 subunit gamma/tau
VKFILATTDPQKIPVTVLSRCLQFNLKQLSPILIATRLQYVLEQEQMVFEPAALNLLARAAQGSMRDALSLLDQAISFSAASVTEQAVRDMLGSIDQSYLYDLLRKLHRQDGVGLLAVAESMAGRSVALDAALQDLATLLHRIAVAQTVPQALAEDDPERALLLELAQLFAPEEVQLCYQIAIHGRDEIDLAPDEYAGFTMTLLRMLAFMPGKRGANLTLPVMGKAANAAQPDRTLPAAAQAAPAGAKMQHVSPAPQAGQLTDWGVIISALNVRGMALQLAKHCVLVSLNNEKVVLSLAQEHKHLQSNQAAQDKLQSVLTDYFAKPIKLQIVLAESSVVTPADVEQQTRQEQQQHASDAINQDSFVRAAQAELGAKLIMESIKATQ